jgi:WhiB family transcriptional regulator, redox-sensing transcriptional regulator
MAEAAAEAAEATVMDPTAPRPVPLELATEAPDDDQCAEVYHIYPLHNGVDEDRGWQSRALCAQTDPESFFPEKGGSTREAKKICLNCEVKADCLSYALANDERFGIWGGLSERERRRLKRAAG